LTDTIWTTCPRCTLAFPVHAKEGKDIMITTSTFVRKPLLVEGIQVNSENMEQVAVWCGGTIQYTQSKRNFIKLQTKATPQARQNMAFVGDWVLKSDMGFKIYSKRAFDRTFDSY
jgi:hypothetical protein